MKYKFRAIFSLIGYLIFDSFLVFGFIEEKPIIILVSLILCFFCSFFGIWSLDKYRRYAIEKETEEQLFKQKIMTHGIPIKLSQEAKEDLVRMIQAILEKK